MILKSIAYSLKCLDQEIKPKNGVYNELGRNKSGLLELLIELDDIFLPNY